MNSKMTANSQLSITDPKKTKPKTTRSGTESQKSRSHGGLSVGRGRGKIEEGKVQGIRSINGRYKIDRGRVRIV